VLKIPLARSATPTVSTNSKEHNPRSKSPTGPIPHTLALFIGPTKWPPSTITNVTIPSYTGLAPEQTKQPGYCRLELMQHRRIS